MELHDRHGMNMQENSELTKTSNTYKVFFQSDMNIDNKTKITKLRLSLQLLSPYPQIEHVLGFYCFYSMPGNFNRNVIVHLKTEKT